MDGMDGPGSETLDVRQRQLRYEDLTEQIRSRIDGLIGAYAGLELSLEDQQPTINDDYYRLDQLDTSLRNCITQLLPLITQYEQAVAEWNQWDDYMQVTTTDTPWTRQVYRVRMQFFKDASRLPPLPEKVQQLIQEYNDTIVAVRTCRDALNAHAQAQAAQHAARSSRTSNSGSNSRASTPVPVAAHSAAAGDLAVQSPRATPTSAATHSVAAENRGVFSTASTSASTKTTTADTLLQRAFRNATITTREDSTPRLNAFQPVQAPASDPPAATQTQHPSPRPNTAPPVTEAPVRRPILKQTKPQVRIVTELDHGDRTPSNQGDEDGRREFGDFTCRQPDTVFREADLPQTGLFSFADASGNVHAPSRPAVLERNPAKSGFWAPYNASPTPTADDFTAPAASPQPHGDARTTSAQQTSVSTTGPKPHSGTGTAGHDSEPPSYVPPQPVSIATSGAPDQTRTTTYQQAADDRGLNGSTPPLPTPPISAQPAPSTAPTDDKVDPESTNSFYRAATCNFRAPIASAPPLILKELPFEPFDGDIRKFPSFRDRFLETMHSYRDIGPRHRLQYLLQCLKGPPRSLVEAYAIRDENYWIVLELLEDRYGDKNRIAKLLIKDVLGHRLPSNSTAELQQFHDNMFRAVQTLKLVDSDIDPHVNLYGDVVLGKLPAEVRKEIIQQPGFTTPAPVSATLKGLRKYLNTMAQVNEAGYNDVIVAMKGGAAQGSNPQARQRQLAPQGGSGHNQYTFPAVEAEDPGCTVAAPRSARKDWKVQCAFCGQRHFSGRCNLYRTIEQRLKRVKQLNLCLLCLRAGHWSDVCPSRAHDVSCKYCSNRHPHHVALCRGYMSQRPGRQLNASVNQPSPHGGSEAPRSRPTNAVNGQGRRYEPAANHVRFSSAQYSPPDNSNDNRKKQSGKKKKNKGTSSSGNGGTPRPTTASAAESTTQQDVQAWDSSGLLPGHSSLLQTDRCPNTAESTQHTDDIARRQYEDELSWLVALRACEEVSSPESIGHGSEPNFEDFGSEFDEPTEYPESSGYAVCSSTPPDTQAVILECVKAIAVNPRNGASREVIVFFDSGSTASYVSTELARALDLPRHAKRQLQINTFAATTPTTLEGFSTSLVLRSARGRSIALDATAADNIVRSVRTAFVTNEELPQLRKNDCALISTRETPDLLIGQDLVHLFDRRHEKRLPNGCYVVHTVLGPMVGGAGQVITTVPRDAVQSHVADTGRMESTLCFPGSGAPADIFDRSTPNLARNAQTASSMNGTLPITTSSGPAHSASPDTIPSQKSAGTHSVPADGHSPGEPFSTYLCGLVDKTDAELLGDFSYLENAGIGTAEMTPDDQTAAEMLKTMHQRESDGRYKVPLLFRTATGAPPSNDELPTNAPLARGRAISTRNSLIKAPEKLKTYDGIIRDYEARGFICKAPLFKETSTTTATRPVFDASAKLPGRSCLNDWVFRGPVLLPVVPATLLRSRFPVIIIVCDIGKAFLQMSVLDSHRDCLRFYWFKDPFAEPDEANTIEYRFNRVPFGLKSSPYLLAGVIKMHLEQEGTPLALEMLKNCYVDNVLLMADNVNEALQKYRDSKATFAKIQMPLREYASNNSQFNNAIDPADRAELEKLRELGIRWDVTADYWDIPLMPKPGSMPTHSVGSDTAAAATGLTEVPAHSAGTTGPKPSKKAKRKRGKKTNDGRLTKRSMLRF
ncbi:Pao retrotransposon peptidase family protein, partial [Aphelenchoides avenae]